MKKILTLIVAMAAMSMTTVSAFSPEYFVKESGFEYRVLHRDLPNAHGAETVNLPNSIPAPGKSLLPPSRTNSGEIDITKFNIGVCIYSGEYYTHKRSYINTFIPTENGYKLTDIFGDLLDIEIEYDSEGKLRLPLGQVLQTWTDGSEVTLAKYDNGNHIKEGYIYFNVSNNELSLDLKSGELVCVYLFDKDGEYLGWFDAAFSYSWYIANANVEYIQDLNNGDIHEINKPVCIFPTEKEDSCLLSFYRPGLDGGYLTSLSKNDHGRWVASGDNYWSHKTNGAETGVFSLYRLVLNNDTGKYDKHKDIYATVKFADNGAIEKITFDTQWTGYAPTSNYWNGILSPAVFTVDSESLSITDIEDDTDSPVEFYNLQGIKIKNPVSGQMLIKKQGNTTSKIIF